jgi:hypothetical protein
LIIKGDNIKIKINKKSDFGKAWYDDFISQEFKIKTHQFTKKTVTVRTSNCIGDGVVCLNGFAVWYGDFEFVKEQDNERN